MGTEVVEGKERTSNWNIVITILHCGIVDVKRIHIHRTVIGHGYVAVRLMLVFLHATVLHLWETFQLEP